MRLRGPPASSPRPRHDALSPELAEVRSPKAAAARRDAASSPGRAIGSRPAQAAAPCACPALPASSQQQAAAEALPRRLASRPEPLRWPRRPRRRLARGARREADQLRHPGGRVRCCRQRIRYAWRLSRQRCRGSWVHHPDDSNPRGFVQGLLGARPTAQASAGAPLGAARSAGALASGVTAGRSSMADQNASKPSYYPFSAAQFGAGQCRNALCPV